MAAIVAINLGVLIACGLGLKNSRKHFEHLANVQAQNLAEGIEQSLSHSVDKIYQSTRAVVYEAERQLASGKINTRELQGAMDQQKLLLSEATGIRLIDAHGDILLGYATGKNARANIANRDYFVYLKRHTGASTAASALLTSRYTGDKVITFAHRINYPDGRFAGAVTIPISVGYFKALLSRFDVGAHGMLALLDGDLQAVVTYPESLARPNGKAGAITLQPMKKRIASGRTAGSYRSVSQEEPLTRDYAFRRLNNAPFYAIAGLAPNDYLTRWYRELWESLTMLFAFMSVTGWAGWRLYRTWQQQERDMQALQDSQQSLRNALAELNERDRALATAQEKGRLGVYVYDVGTQKLLLSPESVDLLGLAPQLSFDIDAWERILHPDDREAVLAYRDKEVFGKNGKSFDYEYRIVRPDTGEVRWLYTTGFPEFDAAGHPACVRGVSLDITERKRHEEQLQMAHQVFLHAHEAVIIMDENIRILDVNPAFSEMTGYRREEALGEYPGKLFHIEGLDEKEKRRQAEMGEALDKVGCWEGDIACNRKDGSAYIQASRISVLRDAQGRLTRYVMVASDVTELRASQNQIEHLAYHDRLTNLPNRTMLSDRLKQAMAQAERRAEMLGVCYLDLDGFKAVNDRWGHDTGDAVLRQVAERLLATVRAGDTVARLGGDEFVVLLSNVRDVAEIERAIGRMQQVIAQPFKTWHTELQLTASLGVSIYPDDVTDADLLIRRADQAMYIAKHSGKNQFHLFDTAADRQRQAQQDLSLRIAAGLEQDEFRLHYQPKVNMVTGEIIGMEALIRWQHPEKGLLAPTAFLPVIENTDLSIRLGEWVMRQALQQMQTWLESGRVMPVSVNLSGFHLQRPDFVRQLSAMLAAFPQVKPEWLQLEILETVAMKDIDAVSEIIAACAQYGVSFALDDFGTGYSSLTYFRRLPTQLLKIDRTFVRDMLKNREDHALIESIIRLAQSFHREVIAEGVETMEQGLALMRMGCHLAQGYGIAKPMPAEAVLAWCQTWTLPQAWRETATPPTTHANAALI